MNNEWQKFLKSQGADITEDGLADFHQPTSGDCNLLDLSHLGLLAVEGPDADDFLQGQLSNDVRELTETHSQLSSHCSAKGRMLANFRAIRRDDTIYLQMPKQTMPALMKRLTMFKLRARVELRDAEGRMVAIGLAGGCAATLLKDQAGVTLESENAVARQDDVTFVRMPGETPRYQMLGPVAPLSDLWNRLAEGGAVPATIDRWNLLEIRAGIPTVYATTSEAFVPQMTNMQLVDGVSFNKGCYTGQEVVARMQYLGKLKRRMYRAEVATDKRPGPGDELFSDASESGQGTGKVVASAPCGPGRHELLAVAEIAAVEHGDVRLGEAGPLLEFRDLPYAFAEPDSTAS